MRIRFLLSVAIVAMATAGTSIAASADTPIPTPITPLTNPSDVVQFSGVTSQLTCDDPGAVEGDCPSPVGIPLTEGQGTYSFSSTSCRNVSSRVDGNDPGELPSGTGSNCSITSNGGQYTNDVCGTGWAAGFATLDAENDPNYFTGNYGIIFAAGVGTVFSTSPGNEPDSGTATINGTVVLQPTTLPAGKVCTTGFTVDGTVTINEAQGAP
jgi:hypothetical protein